MEFRNAFFFHLGCQFVCSLISLWGGGWGCFDGLGKGCSFEEREVVDGFWEHSLHGNFFFFLLKKYNFVFIKFWVYVVFPGNYNFAIQLK